MLMQLGVSPNTKGSWVISLVLYKVPEDTELLGIFHRGYNASHFSFYWNKFLWLRERELGVFIYERRDKLYDKYTLKINQNSETISDLF